MCRKLGVSRSGYYSWLSRSKSKRTIENEALTELIRAIHKEHRELYGSPRIHAVLKERGYQYNIKRVERLMRVHGIVSKVTKRFKPRKQNYLFYTQVPNVLLKRGMPTKKNETWVGDVTYIRANGKWSYLAVVMDLYTRKILGWAYGPSRKFDLVKEALSMAVRISSPGKDTIFHSDQGIEYTVSTYQQLVKSYGITPSMSRKGHCWDNAWTESFFHTLKTEMVYFQKFASIVEATAFIMDYITFYNHKRIHSSLNYTTPVEYHLRAA